MELYIIIKSSLKKLLFVASFVRLFTISKDIQRWLYAPTAETITRVELCEGEFDLLSCINQVLEELGGKGGMSCCRHGNNIFSKFFIPPPLA